MIVGSKVDSISAKKLKAAPVQKLEVNIKMNHLKKPEGAADVLELGFTHTVFYYPDVAEITVEGALLLRESEAKIKELLSHWSKKQMLPDDYAPEVISAISFTSTAASTLAAYGIGIRAPINVPRTRLEGGGRENN